MRIVYRVEERLFCAPCDVEVEKTWSELDDNADIVFRYRCPKCGTEEARKQEFPRAVKEVTASDARRYMVELQQFYDKYRTALREFWR